jgi:hypothetical protein
MQRLLLPFLGSLLGAALGVVLVQRFSPAHPTTEVGGEAGEDGLREQVAELLRRLPPRTGLAPAPVAGPSGSSASGTGGAAGTGTFPAAPSVIAATDLDALATRLAQAMEDRRLEREKSDKEKERARRQRRPLADVARELQLSGAEESDVRRAYEEAAERMLKLMAEPESDAETLRRELAAVKGDPAKRMATMTKYMPKFVSKLGEVMAIQAETESRIVKAVGAEKAAKLQDYQLEEEDPFGMGGEVNVGVTAGG